MSLYTKDITLSADSPKELLLEKHVEFITKYGKSEDDYEFGMTDYLRISGMYWGLTALELVDKLQTLPQAEVVLFIKKCQDEDTGGISACINHDPHLLHTLSAVQILCTYDQLDKINTDRVVDYVVSLQQPDGSFTELLLEKHVEFITKYGKSEDDYEFGMTDYLRISGMYWGLTALELVDKLQTLPQAEVVLFIKKCQDEDTGGISACINHDPHLLHTLSAVQILCTYDQLDKINTDRVVDYVVSLQQPDGSFTGDKWGEVDTRFSFCAVATLALLNRLDAIDVEKAVAFVESCKNFDGGFGSRPLSESHAGLIYCCLGFLSITNRLDIVNREALAWWLCERQLPSGGLNGRPEKLPDVCYSWWVLSSLTILGRLHWINASALKSFILACQDVETGGFSDRPGDIPDPYHTLFGLAALSLLGSNCIKPVNPTFCMPQHVIDRLKIKYQLL
ncbi:hypothetical protein RN001_011344 [Aquatica leii]|uniref:Geranylgeranyl transferase type-2 subunit beta n=1 Tax=Aquatica leii TaxID=1421715 RepID=A0AAN7QI26_9COLE|nr:hypothetical protein RN001_011344 [Aquatica leii]